MSQVVWRLRVGLILFLVSFGFQIFAQDSKVEIRSGARTGFDSNYIRRFPNQLVVRYISEYQSTELNYAPGDFGELAYMTNNPMNYGVGIDYKWLSLEYTTRIPFDPPEKEYGSTQLNGIGLGISSRKFWFKSFYQFNKGFYLDETDKWIPGYTAGHAGDYYQRPDLQTQTYFASLTYGFNHRKFSNNAALYQLEQQIKSAGTFAIGIAVAHNSHQADSNIIPRRRERQFEFNLLESSRLLSIGISGGYLHNFVWGMEKNWFCSLAILPGFLYQTGTIRLESQNEKSFNSWSGGFAEGRLSFGYNGEKWLVGLSARAFSMLASEENNPIQLTYSYGQFFLGYRFALPETRNRFLRMLRL